MTPGSDPQGLIRRYVTVRVTVCETTADGRPISDTLDGYVATRSLRLDEIERYGKDAFRGVAEEGLIGVTGRSTLEDLAAHFAEKVKL